MREVKGHNLWHPEKEELKKRKRSKKKVEVQKITISASELCSLNYQPRKGYICQHKEI